jgi:hypothetical protein
VRADGRDERIAVQRVGVGGGDQSRLDRAGTATFADDQVAQQALVGAPVIGRQALLSTPGDDPLAGGVSRLGGEQAVIKRDDLIPAPRGVKAALKLSGRTGAERVLELVAIAPLLLGAGRRVRPPPELRASL